MLKELFTEYSMNVEVILMPLPNTLNQHLTFTNQMMKKCAFFSPSNILKFKIFVQVLIDLSYGNLSNSRKCDILIFYG